MKTLNLYRIFSNDKGTLGLIEYNEDILCYTLELPWYDNQRCISCIPNGFYTCEIWNSPKFGMTFEVMNVFNRDKILIHKGNWITDIEGCILVGMQQSITENGFEVLQSTIAFNKFKKVIGSDIGFNLNIQ